MHDGRITGALSTRLEEAFVSPLTAVRGILEILRDFPDLSAEDRAGFIGRALDECQRMERGVADLADSVYSAAREPARRSPVDAEIARRIEVRSDANIIELDLSHYVFTNSEAVRAFYGALEALVRQTRKRWYLLVNAENCRVWPEAWVAYAHWGRKIALTYAHGTVRYDTSGADDHADTCASRDDAMAQIGALKCRQPP